LGRLGGVIILVARDEARAAQAKAQIERVTTPDKAHILVADLSSQAEVRRLATEVQSRFPQLDVLVNNAGAVFSRRRLSMDGLEMTLALNHLAPFLLTSLLLDKLKASGAGRVVTVASIAHIVARIPFENMSHDSGYTSLGVYGQTKLMNIMFTYALARRLNGYPVTANALHPGVVASNFGASNGGAWKVVFAFARPFFITAEQGAQTSVYLASSPAATHENGHYFIRSKPAKSSSVSYDVAAQERLWALSEELTSKSR
jgi:NAD(P)-dependent dehydrogenase (short-subunit alcohol dehydrogenase family)